MDTITHESINLYKTFLQEEEKSQNTITKYMRDVRAFALWMAEKNLCKQTVLAYKEHLLAQNYAPRSINSVLSSLNSFFHYCGIHHLKVKMLKIQRQIFAQKTRELSVGEYERLLLAAKRKGNEKLYLLMQTLCSTGIRVSELASIDIDSIKCGEAIVRLKGKLRVIIIPKDLCKRLRCYAKEQGITNGSVFVTKHGRPLDRTYIWRLMRDLCDDAGVAKEKVFPHNFRHLFARVFYSIQKDIVRFADILGHSCVDTTRLYTMETGNVHRKQIQSLGLLRL